MSRSRGADAIDRRVLHPVGDPHVGDARCAQRLAHCGADAAAGGGVADPERAHGLVGMREREIVGGLRMREQRRVEVQADPERLRPVDPAGEMLRADRVAVDAPCAELAVEGVQVEAMRAGNQRQGLRRVAAELVRRARLARDSCRSRRCLRPAGRPGSRIPRHRLPASSGARWTRSQAGAAPPRCRRRGRRTAAWRGRRRRRSMSVSMSTCTRSES